MTLVTHPASVEALCGRVSIRVSTPYTLHKHFSLYTLHPTPCNLHPTPYTLHPSPFTLHPPPYTLAHRDHMVSDALPGHILHPTPYTLHPEPYTLHPTPFTQHPAPYTLAYRGHEISNALPGHRRRAATREVCTTHLLTRDKRPQHTC